MPAPIPAVRSPLRTASRRPRRLPRPIPQIDIDALTSNFARLVEEGGRALAAYLKPREDGAKKVGYSDEINDAVKTLGQVVEYWHADPERAVEMQTRLGKAYLDLWASAARRLAGENSDPVATPSPRDKRFADPEWKSNQFFDFVMQAYLLTTQWANDLVRDAEGLDPHTRKKADVLRPASSPTRSSPSNFVFTNPEVLRETADFENARQSRARHEDAGRGYRGRPRRRCASASPIRRNSRSASTWRPRRAR